MEADRPHHPGDGNVHGGYGFGYSATWWALCQGEEDPVDLWQEAFCAPSVQYISCPYPLCNCPHGLDAGPVEIIIELACLDELVVLNVLLHLFSRYHKVVILPIHLILTPRPRSI